MANEQTIPHPNTGLIRAQNARSIARRASVSALAQSVARTDFASLTRNPRRQIGGRFEAVIPEPDPIQLPSSTVPDDLINQFFSALTFASTQQVVPRQNVIQGAPSLPPLGRAGQAVRESRINFFSGRNPFLRTNTSGSVGRF